MPVAPGTELERGPTIWHTDVQGVAPPNSHLLLVISNRAPVSDIGPAMPPWRAGTTVNNNGQQWFWSPTKPQTIHTEDFHEFAPADFYLIRH